MADRGFPVVLLCCRCCTAVPVDDDAAKKWSTLTHMRRTTLDICPACTRVVLTVLREPPDVMAEHDVHR
jgi:hypothetical protein